MTAIAAKRKEPKERRDYKVMAPVAKVEAPMPKILVADPIHSFVPPTFSVEAGGFTLTVDTLTALPPESIAYLVRTGFATVMSAAAYLSPAAKKNLTETEIVAKAAELRRAKWNALMAGKVTSGGAKRFVKLSPEEKAKRLASKMSDEEKRALLAVVKDDKYK